MELRPVLAAYATTLRQWAAERPGIVRLWLFGNCLEETGRREPHVDVAFEVLEVEKEDRMSFVRRVVPEWEQELSRMLRVAVHLQPTAIRGIPDGAPLVYDRHRDGGSASTLSESLGPDPTLTV